jgi:hypothetical protein
VHDFLVGVRVNDLEESGQVDAKSSELGLADHKMTEAERLRLVYEIITSAGNEGGANISPENDKYVDSIFPLHNDALNKVKVERRHLISVIMATLLLIRCSTYFILINSAFSTG